MIFPFNQNYRTSTKPFSLSLFNTVNTGVSYATPSGTVPNQQRWASAGFRGFGPSMTFPGGAGLDGLHGCGCGGNGGGVLWALAGAAAFWLFSNVKFGRGYGD